MPLGSPHRPTAALRLMGLGLCTVLIGTPAYAASVSVPADYPTVQAAVDAIESQHPQVVDTVIVSSGHTEPGPLNIQDIDLALIGVPDEFGVLPILPRTSIIEGSFQVENLRFSGPMKSWSFTEFRNCVIDSGLITTNDADSHGLRFVNCVIRGEPALTVSWWVEIESCQIEGGIRLHWFNDGFLTLRNSTVTGPGGYGGVGITLETSQGCTIENNVIRGFVTGISAASDGGGVSVIRNNRIEDCTGTGIVVPEASTGVTRLIDNEIRGCGVGILAHASAEVRGNVILESDLDGIQWRAEGGMVAGNVVGRSGRHGVALVNAVEVTSNTSYGNGGSGFAALDESPNVGAARFSNNIGYANLGFGLSSIGAHDPVSTCNDWFGNTGGATEGMSPSATDLALDPQFCDLAQDVVTLAASSPLLDAPGCGLIGARGEGCETTVGVPLAATQPLALAPIAPNPATERATIELRLPHGASATLDVLDLQGRRITTLVRGGLTAGSHRIDWDLSGSAGKVPPGIYLVRFRASNEQVTRRLFVTH